MASRRDDLLALAQCLRGSVPASADWERLLALANRTLATPALAEALRGNRGVPGEVHSFLQEIERRSIRRNMLLRGQLEEALLRLNQVGVTPILLKGTAMLAEKPAGTFSRILSDLDLLLPQDALEPAIAALGELGYSYHLEAPNGWDVHALAREQDAGMIDLHWRIKIAQPLIDHAFLAAGAREVALGQGRALVPSAEHQALVLILHDQVQEYDYARGNIDLRHLVDLAAISGAGRVDWAALLALAEASHVRNAVRVQLCSLTRLLGVDVPDAEAGGVWPRLQHWRRLFQLRHSAAAPLFTLLTLALDPPLNPPLEAGRAGVRHPDRKPFWRFARLWELMRKAPLPTKA